MKSRNLLFLLALLMSSCFENDYLDDLPITEIEIPFTIKKVELTDIEFSTYLEDSIITSNKESFLLGNYPDPIRGHVIAEPYFQFELQTQNQSFEDYHVLDSLVLSLHYEGSHYDTAALFPLSVYAVYEEITPPEDEAFLYNFDTFSRGFSPILTVKKQLFPSDDSLSITLPYDFANNLWLKGKGSTSIFTTTDDFREALPGLSLSADGTSPLMSFTKESRLIFYYHNEEDMEPDVLDYQIPIGDLSNCFTHMEVDLSRTPFQDLKSYDVLDANQSQNLAISDELSGASSRILINNLNEIADVPYEYYISEANLYIPIKKGTYNSTFNTLAQQIDVYIQSENKKTKSYLTTTTLNSFDEIFQEATYYTIPVTEFIEEQIIGSETERTLLLDIYPEQSFTTSYLVVGENSDRYKTRLEITIIPLN